MTLWMGWITFLFVVCTGCYKDYLYVQQEWVDANFLASTKVETPDPRQKDPPRGPRLVVAWDFPKSLFQAPMTLVTTVRFWDQKEEVIQYPMDRRRDITSFFFENRRILTYRVDVLNAQGATVSTWEHHFWTKKIVVE